jgi:ABC-type nitrate/sulfonate/bicarbonate transport system substrate-binding protein
MRKTIGLIVAAGVLAAACTGGGATSAPSSAASAGGSAGPSGGAAAEKPKIVMAFSGTTQPDDIVGYYLVDLLASKYGYEVDAQRLSSDASRPAFLAGQIDIVEQNAKNVAGFVESGAKVFCFSVHDNVLTYVPVAAGQLNSPADLPARPKVGISVLTAIDTALWKTMAASYGSPTDYDLVIIGGQGARRDALLSKQVDVVLLGAANAIRAQSAGDVTLLNDYMKFNSLAPNDAFCVRRDWYESTPGAEQALLDFTKASMEAARWFYTNPDEWKARLIKEIPDFPQDQIEPFRQVFVSVDQYGVNGGLTQEGVDAAIKLALDAGDFTEAPKTEDWIDFTFEQRALEELGEFTKP